MKIQGRGAFLAGLLIALGAVVSCQPDRKGIEPTTPVATGACCNLSTGACTVLTPDQCGAQAYAHEYKGNNTTCTPSPCSVNPATGVCCDLNTGACTVTAAAQCLAQTSYFVTGGNCAPNLCQQPRPEGDYTATTQVMTTGSALLKTATGAAIQVPKFAIPRAVDGAEGKVSLSIERDLTVTPVLPRGTTKVSLIYRFGPEDFTFAKPVKVSIPVLTPPGRGKALLLYRYNQSTAKSEAFGAFYDSIAGTLTAETYKLSPWYAGYRDESDAAWGAFHVVNSSTTHWLNLCVTSVQLAHPEADSSFVREMASGTWAPVGEIGWANESDWHLPQGTYTICAEMSASGTLSSPPGPPYSTTLTGLQISHPWTRENPVTATIPSFSGPTGWSQVACDCTPTPTPPIGTGQVQVTLTWHYSHRVDLDLYVTEPSNEVCYYGHASTATGGKLDVDNSCGNWVVDRPENIFWTQNAPTGQYKVEVNYFNTCDADTTDYPVPFDLRVVNGPGTRTYHGQFSHKYETIHVTDFTVAAAGTSRRVLFGPPLGTPGQPGLAGKKDKERVSSGKP